LCGSHPQITAAPEDAPCGLLVPHYPATMRHVNNQG
jgi:hypothetical protein